MVTVRLLEIDITARTRNPDRTRRAILDAAAAEFCAVGPAGARIDAIAEAAGVNKRMLYHYFTSKDGLFAAVLDDRLGPEPVAAAASSLMDRHIGASDHPDRIRLLMWQALAADAQPTGSDFVRTPAWPAWVADPAAAHRRYESDLDAAHLELSFAAIALFPFAFPQLTRLITGRSPTDAEFIAARSAFLAAFEARLGRTASPETAKPRYRLAASVTESAARSQPPRQIDAKTSK